MERPNGSISRRKGKNQKWKLFPGDNAQSTGVTKKKPPIWNRGKKNGCQAGRRGAKKAKENSKAGEMTFLSGNTGGYKHANKRGAGQVRKRSFSWGKKGGGTKNKGALPGKRVGTGKKEAPALKNHQVKSQQGGGKTPGTTVRTKGCTREMRGNQKGSDSFRKKRGNKGQSFTEEKNAKKGGGGEETQKGSCDQAELNRDPGRIRL